MQSTRSVTQWLERLQAGDRDAAQKLWEGPRVPKTPPGALVRPPAWGSRPWRSGIEPRVESSEPGGSCGGVEQGRFPRRADRRDLWQVLVVLTARKAVNLIKHEGRDKRDWRRTATAQESPAADDSFFPELIGREPDPAFAAQVAEEGANLL